MMDLMTALGLFLVAEGLLLAILPQAMQRAMRTVSETPPDTLRIAGIIGGVIGAAIVYATRKWFI